MLDEVAAKFTKQDCKVKSSTCVGDGALDVPLPTFDEVAAKFTKQFCEIKTSETRKGRKLRRSLLP